MTALRTELDWFLRQPLKGGQLREICQCGSEQVISRSTDPTRMRALLLSLCFIDQFIYSHYIKVHAIFRMEFPIPKLNQHSFHGHASPSWLVYSHHEFDQLADWDRTVSTLRSCLLDAESWLSVHLGQEPLLFWSLVRQEISIEFEPNHQNLLMVAIQGGASESFSAL